MQKFFENVFSGVGINDVVDILIVAFAIYQLLKLIKQTRAEQLLKGIIVLVIVISIHRLDSLFHFIKEETKSESITYKKAILISEQLFESAQQLAESTNHIDK